MQVKYLKKDEPQIHIARDVLLDQLSSIMARFTKPEALLATDDVTKLDLAKMDNQKSYSKFDLLVGYECKKFIQENEKQFDLCAFYDDARGFYRGVCQYMIGHYPFNDPILSSAYILDVSKRTAATFNHVEYFVVRFKRLPLHCMYELQSEFATYQAEADSQARIDKSWFDIGKAAKLSMWHFLSLDQPGW